MRLPPPRPSAPACAAALLAAVLSTTPLLPERAALAEPGTTQLLSSLFSCQKAIIKGKEELVCTQAIDDAGELVKDPLPNPLEKYLPPLSTPLPRPRHCLLHTHRQAQHRRQRQRQWQLKRQHQRKCQRQK